MKQSSKNMIEVHETFRAWQINEFNSTNKINRINNRLIDLCKSGPGLIRINGTLSLVHNPINLINLL